MKHRYILTYFLTSIFFLSSICLATETPVKTKYYALPGKKPSAIIRGTDDKMWFVESDNNKIAHMDPISQQITEYPLPTKGAFPYRLVADAKNIWFTERTGNKIGKLEFSTKKITEYSVPTSRSAPFAITIDHDGNIWFTETDDANDKIGKLNPATGQIKEYTIPTPYSFPAGIVIDAQNNIWFTEMQGNKIGKFNQKTQKFTEYRTSTNWGPTEIVIGADAKAWFIESWMGTGGSSGQIGSINLQNGRIKEMSDQLCYPQNIIIASDSNIWMGGIWKICKLNPKTHVFSEYSINEDFNSSGLAVDVDGNIWSTDDDHSGIYVLNNQQFKEEK